MLITLPPELVDRDQWVSWRYETRNNKPTKVPLIPGTQSRASSTDPTTWRSLDDAAADDTSSGIGYVFAVDDPFVGVDLDDCLVHNGDGPPTLAPWASDILAGLPATYTEVSPSGNGLKLWLRGSLPAKCKHRRKMADAAGNVVGEIEVYDRGRFFCVTGERYGDSPLTIAEADLAELYARLWPTQPETPMPTAPATIVGFPGDDDELIRRARRSNTSFGPMFDDGELGESQDHSAADLALVNQLAWWSGPDRERIDRLFRLSALCRAKWTTRADYRDFTISKALDGRTNFYTPRDPDAVPLPRSDSRVFQLAGELKPYLMTDLGNAERLVDHYRGQVRHVGQTQKWFTWDGKRWGVDRTGRVMVYATQTAKAIFTESKLARDTEPLDDDGKRPITASLASHALKTQSRGRLESMVKLAESRPGVAAEVDDMDADPWLFNARNGTIDLRTGVCRPHDHADLITNVANAGYRPDITAPTWGLFLEQIFEGNQDLIEYVQELLGMCMCGDIGEQVLPVFWGGGANGKSTLLDTVMHVIGTYAGKAAPNLIMAAKHDAHPTEIADLWGRRLVVTSETEQGRALKVSLVKEMTGDSTLKARYMRGDFFEFRRTHKLILMTNNKPRITEGGHAIWRRLKLVPFRYQVPDDQRDRDLPRKLLAEKHGILNWLVKGCQRWHANGGFTEPYEVASATAEYREDEDPLEEFKATYVTLDADAWTANSEIKRAYRQWAEAEHVRHPLSERALIDRMRDMSNTVRTTQKKIDGRATRGLSCVRLSMVAQ